jgi:DNA polymerase-1
VADSFFEAKSRAGRLGQSRPGPARGRAIAKDYLVAVGSQGCSGCSLYHDRLRHPKMKPTGDANPVLYVLGEAPGEDEDSEGRQFVGRSGKLLREAMRRAGVDVAVCWDNCVRCRPSGNRTPTQEEIERCRKRVVASIERARPQVILAVGAVALAWLTGETAITKWRGKLMPARVGGHRCWVYPILHPSFVLRSGRSFGGQETVEWEPVFRRDLRGLAARLAAGLGRARPESPTRADRGVCYATDSRGLSGMLAQLGEWANTKATVAFDIETAGLRPYFFVPSTAGWLSIAVSDGEVTWVAPAHHRLAGWLADDARRLREGVLAFLKSPCMKVAHNLAFELEWLTWMYAEHGPWRRTGWGDTMAQSYILDEHPGVHSLDSCCLYALGMRIKSLGGVSDRSKMSEVPFDVLLRYNAIDAKYTAKLYAKQREEILAEGLLDTYKMQIRRTLTLVKAQQKGLVVNFDTVEKFSKQLDRKIMSCMFKIQDSEEAALYERKTGKPLSPSSNLQLTVLFRDILGRPEGNRSKNKSGYSVDDAALSAMGIPMADAILELRTLQKQKSTYVDPCMPVGGLVSADGRLHTNFNAMATVTGRLSSDSPNVQNFPKREHGWIRAMVSTPKLDRNWKIHEHVMVSADYGQIEPRVIAMASRDRKLCDSIRDRVDIHLDWAERIAEADPKTYRRYGKNIKKLRQDVKSNWVLAGFYGAEYESVSARLGGLQRCCRDLFEQFKSEFAGVWRWQDEQQVAYHRDGYVVGLSGRRRRAPLSTNQLLNNTIQGAASDIVVEAMSRLSVRADREDQPAFQAVLDIHDDLTFYVPKDEVDRITGEIVREMLRPVYDWMVVPLSVEVAVGPNWADLKPIGVYFSDEVY